MGVSTSTPTNKDFIKLLETKSRDLNAFKTGRKTDQRKEKNKDGLEIPLYQCLVHGEKQQQEKHLTR